ncbi:hypothetical protein [Streptomyces sp. NPDC005476]|uniref:hypothetical protein n=1 Tax=Streptomyces sp. NPDC005476 TaxID=3156882 RepID=UPI00345409B4
MGVLARLFRRSGTTEATAAEATSADEAPVGTPADGAEAEQVGEPATAEPAGTEEAVEPESGTTVKGTPEPVAVAAADGVEIPRQQSAEEAADSEAGEGAHA